MKSALEGSRFLVTGGCGFIGTNLVRRLHELGATQVVALDDLSTGNRAFLPEGDGVQLVEGSVTNRKLVAELAADVDYILHAARPPRGAEPSKTLTVSAAGTLAVLDAARKSAQVRKVVHLSDAVVYGNTSRLPLTEDTLCQPLSTHAVAVLAGEGYARAYYHERDVLTCVLRLGNVFGPWQSPRSPNCGVVGRFIDSIVREGEVAIRDTGQQTRDFVFVDDAVDATILAAVSARSSGGTFNIGSGREVSVRKLSRQLFTLLKRKPKEIAESRTSIDDFSRQCLSIERVRVALRWQPQHAFEAGLKKTVSWYEEHRMLVQGRT